VCVVEGGGIEERETDGKRDSVNVCVRCVCVYYASKSEREGDCAC